MASVFVNKNIIAFKLSDTENQIVQDYVSINGPKSLEDLMNNWIIQRAAEVQAVKQETLLRRYAKVDDATRQQIDNLLAKGDKIA